MGRHLQQQTARRPAGGGGGPLWNGFINLPRMAGGGINLNKPAAVSQPSHNHHGEFRRPSGAAPQAANQRFQARLNNDLKQLWQASPPDRGAYTASTSMPAFSDDILFSGSLFRRPLLRMPVPYQQHHLRQPYAEVAATSNAIPTPMLIDFPNSINHSTASLFEPSTSGAHPPFMAVSSSEFGDENSSPDIGNTDAADLTNDNAFAGFDTTAMQQPPIAQQSLSQLSVCPRESINIRAQLPAATVTSTSTSTSLYADLCTAMRATCRQVRVALYSDANYIDLAVLRRRARLPQCSTETVTMATYDACPFSPMTTMFSPMTTIATAAVETTTNGDTTATTTTGGDHMLMLDADSGCPDGFADAFGRFVDDDDDDDDDGADSEAGIDSPLF